MAGSGFFSVDALRGVHVLVVDDEPECRDILTRILEYCGALVTAVSGPAEAAEVMRIIRPGVLVVDVGLPDDLAFDFVRRVRALKPEDGGVVPAVAVGEWTSEEIREQIRAAGFNVYLVRPLSPWELCGVISNLLLTP
jgi:CheY-like chemotaxis protein